MKMLIGLISVVMSLTALASSGESRHFNINSSLDAVEGVLRGVQTHTEYEDRTIRTVCYRTETTYRTVCTNPPHRHPPRHPHPRPRYVAENKAVYCETIPYTRTIAYSCTKTERVSYQVKDYDVEARVSIKLPNINQFNNVQAVVSANLSGDSLYLKASGTSNYFIMLNKRNDKSFMSGGIKFMDVNYEVKLLEANPILSTLSLGSMNVENNTLSFEVGDSLEKLSFRLKIAQKKVFRSNPVLIDRILGSHEVELVNVGNKTEARVDFSRLNLDVRGGKFEITAAVEFKDKDLVLNTGDFSNLSASRTLTYKAR